MGLGVSAVNAEITQHVVSQWGYLGILGALMFGIIGIPIPDETLLAFAGFMVYKGSLSPVPTYAVAWAGTTCGITSSYLIGRYVGAAVIRRYGRWLHIDEARMDRVEAWFERGGKWTLPIGYFVPGVRHLTAIVAGSSRLPLHVFALYAWAGGLVWSATFITLGYYVGDAWESMVPKAHRIVLPVVGGVAIVAVVAWLVIRHRRKAGAGKPASHEQASSGRRT